MRALKDTRVRRAVVLVLIVGLLAFAMPDVAAARTPRWIRRVGHIAGHIVNAPNRVATWATKWMGPVLGPVASAYLSGRILANGDIARIVKRAGNVERAANDIKLLNDSRDRLAQVYRDEAAANRKMAEQIERLVADIKADPEAGDVDRLMDLRRMQDGYVKLADRLESRADGVKVKDVLDLLGRSAVRRLGQGAEQALVTELNREVTRLIDKDVLLVLDGDGLRPGDVLNRIVERDAERMLEGTEHAGDKEFAERLRDALKEQLKSDKDFFKKNWRSEVQRLISEVSTRLRSERGEVPTETAEAGEPGVTEEQIGVDPDGVTDEMLPADDGEAGQAVEPLPGIAKDRQWVVWYAADVGYKPLRIDTLAAYEKDWPGNAFPGGGTSDTPIKKKKAGGPFKSLDAARRWLDPQLGEPYYMSGVYAGMYVAKFQGEVHNIEMIGFDPKKFP